MKEKEPAGRPSFVETALRSSGQTGVTQRQSRHIVGLGLERLEIIVGE